MAEHKFSYTWGNVKKKEFPIIEGEATPERENVRERKKEADQGSASPCGPLERQEVP